MRGLHALPPLCRDGPTPPWVALVGEVVHVPVEPAPGHQGGLVQRLARHAALAGAHEHDRLPEALSVGAHEEHGDGA